MSLVVCWTCTDDSCVMETDGNNLHSRGRRPLALTQLLLLGSCASCCRSGTLDSAPRRSAGVALCRWRTYRLKDSPVACEATKVKGGCAPNKILRISAPRAKGGWRHIIFCSIHQWSYHISCGVEHSGRLEGFDSVQVSNSMQRKER